MIQKALLAIVLTAFLAGCSPKGTAVTDNSPVQTETPAKEPKAEPRWAPTQDSYKPSETRVHDLLHTKLDVRFDWEKTYLYGKAWLKLKPYFYPSDELILDAKGMDIHEVALWKDGEKKPLQYEYDQVYLKIDLEKKYSREETYEIFIDYTAKPNELDVVGSAAITDAKGLYFINPDGSEPGKPRQIWTQGETEGSSCWFPTIDAPNERTTQEMFITVENNFVTLSNGLLINSTANEDGTRTDHWKQSIAHAPYLFAMAIGEFSIVKDEWRGKEVSYFVEPEYEKYARLVFGNTPEMIEFFSKKTGVEFPWEKYSQIVVRDFVSGAMENTTAVIHFSALQHDSREHLDSPMEDIIAHELFHHWFGDLVTCESWSNLPLNESFATYGEYLWNEYKYGKDEADYKFLGNLKTYLGESKVKREPLIRFNVRHRDDMFDAHSYQKGSRVLHMLRNDVGDDAFFESIKQYLNKNAYKPAEIHNLRLAVEEVTGADYNWFFNQWFLSPGHPELEVEHGYENGKVTLHVEQKQNLDYMPVFRLPVKVEIVTAGKSDFHEIVINSTDTTFSFPSSTAPDYVVFDADQMLLADITDEDKPREAWMAQMKNASSYLQKQAAMAVLATSVDNPEIKNLFVDATKDNFWGTRLMAISSLDMYMGSDKLDILQRAMDLAKNDEKASVRRTALRTMKSIEPDEIEDGEGGAQGGSVRDAMMSTLETAIGDSSYSVQAAALEALVALDRDAGIRKAKSLENEKNPRVISTIANIYMEDDLPEALDFVGNQLKTMKDGFGKFQLLSSFGEYLSKQPTEKISKGLEFLKEVAETSSAWWIRLGAIRSMLPHLNQPGVREFIEERKSKETNENFVQFLEGALSESEE